jgi:NADPH-dependent glutamate synthase beta subunit-like oxidoreductase/NAD-dependent dihydropyrimidine dehydrogenase PreA subunit
MSVFIPIDSHIPHLCAICDTTDPSFNLHVMFPRYSKREANMYLYGVQSYELIFILHRIARSLREEVSMAYRFQVNNVSCINCGICMDLCPVRCLDMTRPTGEGEIGSERDRQSPIPGPWATREWMMMQPVQVAACIGCQICAQECPTNAITIESSVKTPVYAQRGLLTYLPSENGWQALDAYTRATPEEPGEAPWGEGHDWHVAERHATWQSWRSWLGERKEDLRAPCQAACPVGTNAGLYVSLVGEGRYDEALQVAAEPNPFPSICGRVCTAPCEDACRRGEFDAPIAIRDLKRFATDHGHLAPRKIKPPRHKLTERVAIIGAGPTGLSAAYYLARRGYTVTMYDAMPVAGGMMAIGIPDYRLPRIELHRDIEAISDLGVEMHLNTAVGRDISLDDLQAQFDVVLLAVGAQRSQRLEIPGETELRGVLPATTFLKQYNLEPDTTHLKGIVAVVGGGSTAMDAARSALRAGAQAVHILYRRTREQMPAQADEVLAALAEGIQIHELVTPQSLLGTEDGSVQTVRCERMQLGEPDAKGRRRPIPVPGSSFDISVNMVIVAIGEAPDPSFLPKGTSIEIASWGGLLINKETLATGVPGVFAAGDVTYGPKTIIDAAAHGRLAARSIHAYLRHLSPRDVAEMPDDDFAISSPLPPDHIVNLDLHPTPREIMPLRAADISQDRSLELASGFTVEQAQREARRCLRCDLAYGCPTIHLINPETVQKAQSVR